MNPTDFILAFLSIVLALALQEVLQGVGAVIRSSRVRDLPVAQYLFALALVAQMVGFWWSMWFWRSIATWAVSSFVLMLTGLTLLYLQAYLIFPPDAEGSPETYYLDSAPQLWSLEILYLLVVATAGAVVLGLSIVAQMAPVLVFLGPAVIARRSRSRAVHGALAGMLLAAHVVSLMMQPGLAG